MKKMIKKSVQMRLDELIKYVWENSATEKIVFLGNHGQRVVFDNVGGFYPSGYAYSPDTTFTVEMEEEITVETRFSYAIALSQWGEKITDLNACNYGNLTLGKILESNIDRDLYQIYALIENKLELIWEAE